MGLPMRIRALKDAALLGATIALVVTVTLGWVHQHAKELIDQAVHQELLWKATAAAASVDPAKHRQITRPGQHTEPLYQEAIAPLAAFHQSVDALTYVYTTVRPESEIFFLLDTAWIMKQYDSDLIPSGVMEPYSEPDEALLRTFETGVAQVGEVLIDEWGSFISGFAPIFDESGTLIAVAGVDLDAADYLHRLGEIFEILLYALALSLVLIALISYIIYRVRVSALQSQKLLQEYKDALVDEHHQARNKQVGMVANDFEHDPDCIVQVLYKASDILSGDAYSLHRTPANGAFIYLIDGMGHGLLPSYTAFAVSSTVKQSVSQGDDFATMLERVCQTLRNTLGEEEQLSYSFFHIPPDYQSIEYAIGGMYPAYVGYSGGSLALSANNPPFMTFMPTITPATHATPGLKKMLVYTDGLVEDSHLALSAQEVAALLEGDTFSQVSERIKEADVEDDTTVLYFERTS